MDWELEVLLLSIYCMFYTSVRLLSHVQLFSIPWTAACQASLSITNSWSLLRLMSVESVLPPKHLILCCPLLLLPSIVPNIRVFSSESVLHISWPKYWSFSFSLSPCNEYSYYKILDIFSVLCNASACLSYLSSWPLTLPAQY